MRRAHRPAPDVVHLLAGLNIRRLRRAHDPCLTQRALAEKVGISVSYLSEIERGTRRVSFETIVRITRVLGVRIEELMQLK